MYGEAPCTVNVNVQQMFNHQEIYNLSNYDEDYGFR